MEIKILGTGCATCQKLEQATRKVIEDLGIEAHVIKEEDIIAIMSYGVMRTPGLVINGKVAVSGRLPSSEEIRKFIEANL
jgi:small redox-active disulfide protein 2